MKSVANIQHCISCITLWTLTAPEWREMSRKGTGIGEIVTLSSNH